MNDDIINFENYFVCIYICLCICGIHVYLSVYKHMCAIHIEQFAGVCRRQTFTLDFFCFCSSPLYLLRQILRLNLEL